MQRSVSICLGAVLGWCCLAATTLAAENRATPVGRTVDDFSLSDYRGKTHHLSDYRDGKPMVIAFLGVECPLAKVYAPRLAELAAKYADQGVHFLGIDSNQHDSLAELAAYARVHGVDFPLLRDSGNAVADQMAAERTPTVYVLDGQQVIRYVGRIDDQYGFTTGVGYARPRMTSSYLVAALDELLAGKTISTPMTEPVGCLIGRVRRIDPNAEVTYSNQIARVFQNHCLECHRDGEIAPFALNSYEEAAGWAEMIEEVVRDQRMPPWHADPRHGHFSNDRSMTDEEKELVYSWVRAGAPEGDPSQLPPPREYPVGWQAGQPDFVAYMSDEPYEVPAEGTVEYQYFTVDPGFTEDKWLASTECLLGNRAVVHHVFVFMVPPTTPIPDFQGPSEGRGEFNPGAGGVQLIAGAAPGTPPMAHPAGMATFVPAGSKLVFQMHYTPNGSVQRDRTAVGFRFADPKTVEHASQMNMAINFMFRIPAGASDHPVEAGHTFDQDTLILNLAPHMHLRGKSFRYDLAYPDGRVETILDVPHYDFNWQTIYSFAEPIRAPAGTRMLCYARFDNSEENLANPDPNSEVRWGDQTWEEMMIGWFEESTDVDTGLLPEAERRVAAFRRQIAEKPLELKAFVTRLARKALKDQEGFEKLMRRVQKDIPQLDRMCLAELSGDQLQVRFVAQPPVIELLTDRYNQSLPAAETKLAEYARGSAPVVNADLSQPAAGDLRTLSKRLRSSVHVPVVIDGRPAVLSVWSQEPDAFPGEVVSYLTELVGSLGPTDK